MTFVAWESFSGIGAVLLAQLGSPFTVLREDLHNLPLRYHSLVDAVGMTNEGCTVNHHGSGLVSTAAHCLRHHITEDCDDIIVFWGYRGKYVSQISRCLQILDRDLKENLDFAFFQVYPYPKSAIPISLEEIAWTDTISLFSYPLGNPLHWSGPCQPKPRSTDLPEHTIAYHCYTAHGSSGAGIISDATLKMVGIHSLSTFSEPDQSGSRAGFVLREIPVVRKIFGLSRFAWMNKLFGRNGTANIKPSQPHLPDHMNRVHLYVSPHNRAERVMLRTSAGTALLGVSRRTTLEVEAPSRLDLAKLRLTQIMNGGEKVIGTVIFDRSGRGRFCLQQVAGTGILEFKLEGLNGLDEVFGEDAFSMYVGG